jgi:hypothetical protein
MVVSRPDGAGFIDPRAEGQAVLKAIKRSAPGRIVVEFLRPATLKSLRESPKLRSSQHPKPSKPMFTKSRCIAPAAIWTTYDLLAKIATDQGETQSAQAYRRQARSAKVAFAGTQYELQEYEPLITAVVTAVADQSAAEELETLLTKRNENGWGQLVAAIRRILAGERLIEALWDDLDLNDYMIIQAIIDRLS